MTDEIDASVHLQFEISKKLGKGAYGGKAQINQPKRLLQ
jgi:hypothetical protein